MSVTMPRPTDWACKRRMGLTMNYIICKYIGNGRWRRFPGVYATREHAERDAILYRTLGWNVTIDETRLV
jgi:hypothetical protein